MAPRCLPLSLTYINSKVQEVFSKVAPSTPAGTASNLWFSAAGVPLRDPSLPFGVLADALLPAGHTGPIPVQVHLSRRASDVVRVQAASWEWHGAVTFPPFLHSCQLVQMPRAIGSRS